jgi:uncharacterized coiled-coil DUF342 family protein
MNQEINKIKEEIRSRFIEGKKIGFDELKLLLNPEDEIT